MKNCLTIAGSDCSGGAGIQADLKTFSALGCFGMSVIVSVVAENTQRVISIHDVSADVIKDQIDAVFQDVRVDAVKVGMLSGIDTMTAVAEKLEEYKPKAVIDPVMIAKGGMALMAEDALDTLKSRIIPLSFLLTPNVPEAETITGIKIQNIEDMKKAAVEIFKMGAENVLIKGGHMEGDAADILYDGKEFHTFVQERINTKNTHGTGCTISSAITACLANGMNIAEAVKSAKAFVTEAIRYADNLEVGKGHGPTNHFWEFYKMKGLL